MNLNIVSAITRKDVVDAIRHRYLLTALVTPLFVALLFRVLLPGGPSDKILTLWSMMLAARDWSQSCARLLRYQWF